MTFTPKYSGARNGAVSFLDPSGTVLGTAYIFGTAIAPQAVVYGYAPAKKLIDAPLFAGRHIFRDEGGTFYGQLIEGGFLGKIYKFTPSGSTYQQTLLASEVNFVTPIRGFLAAIDAAGNIYTIDSNGSDSYVSKATPAGIGRYTGSGHYEPTKFLAYGDARNPVAVAVDPRGNVYIATGEGPYTIYKVSYPNGVYTIAPVLTNLPGPIGEMTVDAAGKITTSATGLYRDGSYNPGTFLSTDTPAVQAAKLLRLDNGAAQLISDSRGNIYTLSPGPESAFVEYSFADTPLPLNFTASVGSSDYHSTFPTNIGNAPLTLSAPPATLPEGYSFDPAGTCPGYGTSSSAPTLAAGANCNLVIDFKPVKTADGSGTSTVAIQDDSLNVPGSNQRINLSANVLPPLPPSLFIDFTLPAGKVGVPYTAQINYGGGVPPLTLKATVALPDGFTLSPAGVLSGTPTVQRHYLIPLQIQDSTGKTDTQNVSLYVNNPAFTISPRTLPPATAGVVYTQTLSVQGGVPPYTFSSENNLPPGFNLSNGGVLSATPPTEAVSYRFTVDYLDSGVGNLQQVGTLTYILSVNPPIPTFGTNFGIDASQGFTSALELHLNGSAVIRSKALQLTHNGTDEAASAWSNAPVLISRFSTDFAFLLPTADADGFTFTLQNQGPNALGYSGGSLGYAGIPTSVAVKFDLYDNIGEQANSVGYYSNGAVPTLPSSVLNNGLDLKSGHVFTAHITYDGISLILTVRDIATNQSSIYSQVLNLPALLGSSTAFVGFTGGTGALTANINILNWSTP